MIHCSLTKLTRLEGRPNGLLDGFDGLGDITEGYKVSGYYHVPPKVGARFDVNRYERNGVKISGQFSTSLVQKIELVDDQHIIFRTENSVYQLTHL